MRRLRVPELALAFLGLAIPAAALADAGLRWDALRKEVGAGAAQARCAFVATNPSPADVVVTSVETSCGCTAAQFPSMPWTVHPGASARLDVTVDLHGERGRVEKSIYVRSGAGISTLTLLVDAGPPAPALDDARLPPPLRRIVEEPDSILRFQETQDFVDGLRSEDIPKILDLTLLPGAGSSALIDVGAKALRRWAEADPRAAGAWTLGIPQGAAFAREAFPIAGEALGRAGREAAMPWLGRIAPGTNRTTAQRAEAGALARTDPENGLALASGLPAGAARDSLLGVCLSNLATRDFGKAEAWLRSLDDPRLREILAERVAVQQAVRDPADAAEFALRALAPTPAGERALAQIVRFWTARSPEPAARWTSAIPPGPFRDAALAALAETWRRKDPAKAKGWLATLSGNWH